MHDGPTGLIESLTRERIIGWAADPDRPGAPVEIALLVDGAPVATDTARLPRPGHAGDKAVLRQGFALAIPPGTPIDVGRLGVRARGADAVLPFAADSCRHEGVLEQVTPTAIGGWAWRIGHPEHRTALTLMLRGKPVAQVVADQFRADLVAAGIGDGRHAFTAPLPAGLGEADVRPGLLQLFFADQERLYDLRPLTDAEKLGMPPLLELLPTQQRREARRAAQAR